jgi:hypothetical protein
MATHTAYNKSGPAVVTVCDAGGNPITPAKFYNRTLTFTNGVASTTVPASVAGDNFRLSVDYKSLAPIPLSELFSVSVGAPSKFVLMRHATDDEKLEVFQTDSQGNRIISFTGDKIMKLTYPTSMVAHKPAGIDSEGNILVGFNSAGIGTIVFGVDLKSGTYTVQHGGLTGTVIIP